VLDMKGPKNTQLLGGGRFWALSKRGGGNKSKERRAHHEKRGRGNVRESGKNQCLSGGLGHVMATLSKCPS